MDEKSLKPQLRFKGFADAWEQRKLGDILKQRIEHQKISADAPLLAFSYSEGVIEPEDKKSNKRDFIMTDKYNKIFSRTEKDDIIYNPANVIHGAIHRNKLRTGVVSPIYKIFKCENVSPKFVGECLHRDKFIEEIIKYIEGTVIKLRTLSPEQFLNMSIKIPISYEEQEKIGTVFSSLDSLITLHQRKLDKLSNVKKALLEKIFPKNDSDVPEIRFKGFTDAWEQRKYEDLGDSSSGGNLNYDCLDENGEYKCVLYGELYTRYDCVIKDVFYRTNKKGNTIFKNDILFPQSTTVDALSLISPACLNDETAETSGVFVVRPKKDIDGNFVAYYTKGNPNQRSKLSKKAQGLTIVHLYYQSIKDEQICIPSYSEQKQISSLFLKLDNLITLHQRKLEKLKNIKKACLEKMFV